jgi:hypothetical protein
MSASGQHERPPGVIQNAMRVRVLAGIGTVALGVVSAANAKAVPRLSKTVAAPGDALAVEFGPGARYYLAPLEVYLVRTVVEPKITGRDDRRLRLVGKLGRVGEPIEITRLAFRVPRVPAGKYTLAVWFKGTVTGRWNNLAQGLWRDATLRDGLLLRVVRPK